MRTRGVRVSGVYIVLHTLFKLYRPTFTNMKAYSTIKEMIAIINDYSYKGVHVVEVWTENTYAVLMLNNGIRFKLLMPQ